MPAERQGNLKGCLWIEVTKTETSTVRFCVTRFSFACASQRWDNPPQGIGIGRAEARAGARGHVRRRLRAAVERAGCKTGSAAPRVRSPQGRMNDFNMVAAAALTFHADQHKVFSQTSAVGAATPYKMPQKTSEKTSKTN